jgi:hypothetical protein
MVLKNGKRCRYRAKEGHFCCVHKKLLEKKRTVLQKLVAAGSVASAAAALIRLVETVAPLLAKAEPFVKGLFTEHVHFCRSDVSPVAEDDRNSRVRRHLSWLSKPSDLIRAIEISRTTLELDVLVEVVFVLLAWEETGNKQ